MLERIKGCMLGAAVGDALGMPNESTMPGLAKMRYGFRKAYKGHPNDCLTPGQYTDDTQMMILVATLLADGRYTDERLRPCLKGTLYPRDPPFSRWFGICSLRSHGCRAGTFLRCEVNNRRCLPAALPFALAYPDVHEAIERAVRACSVTHTHPAAHAAVSTFVTLLYCALHENSDPVGRALVQARNEDEVLGGKIHNAIDSKKRVLRRILPFSKSAMTYPCTRRSPSHFS